MQSGSIIRSIIDGQKGPARDIVLANAAAGVWLTGLEPSLEQAVVRCAAAIDSGMARQKLAELAALSHREEGTGNGS